jgi:hypothetical protein
MTRDEVFAPVDMRQERDRFRTQNKSLINRNKRLITLLKMAACGSCDGGDPECKWCADIRAYL